MDVRRAGFLSFVAAIAAATSCNSAGTPLPEPTLPDAGSPPPVTGDDDDVVEPPRDAAVEAAAVCEDDDGITTSCSGVTGSAACSVDQCELTRAELKSRVARAEIDCVRTEIKLGSNCEGCRRVALDGACPDPTGADTCDRIGRICQTKIVDRDACLEVVAGFTFYGREKFLSCMTESFCARTFGDCLRFKRP